MHKHTLKNFSRSHIVHTKHTHTHTLFDGKLIGKTNDSQTNWDGFAFHFIPHGENLLRKIFVEQSSNNNQRIITDER